MSPTSQKFSFSRHWLSCTIIVILLVCASQVFEQTRAALNYYQVKNGVQRWQEKQTLSNPQSYIQMKTAAQRAVDLFPENPLYLDALAEVYQWGVFFNVEADQQKALATMQQLYLQSVMYRPAWPVTWANLAQLKWRKQEFDQELLGYLSKADALGPSQPEVHELYVNLGLALYKARHPFFAQINQQVKQRLLLGLENPQSRQDVISMVSQYHADKVACRWLKDANGFIRNMLSCEASPKGRVKNPQKG